MHLLSAVSRAALVPTACFAACLAVATPAQAQTTYLVGAYLFSSNSTGATVDQGYQYDTNATSRASFLLVNGVGGSPKSISFALTPASVNNFTFQSENRSNLFGPNATLGLFFSDSPASYNPSPSGSARTPDLLVSVPAGATAFFVPAAGTAINNYAYSGTSTASGLSTFNVNGTSISVASYAAANSANSSVAGSFSLSVGGTASAAPEPGTIALLLTASVPVADLVRRRAKHRA